LKGFRPTDFVSISVYWFALWYLWNSVHHIVLPTLVPLLAPANLKGSALGTMTSLGLLLAVVVQPVAGLAYLLGALVLMAIREKRVQT